MTEQLSASQKFVATDIITNCHTIFNSIIIIAIIA